MNKYKFTYYLNTATAERRPTTKEDIENDWKEEEQEFNSDLEAFEYVYTDILDEYEAGLYDLDEFYNDYEATTDNDKIEAFKSYFDSCDVGDGSTIIVQIKRDNEIIYDSGFSKEDLIDEEEYDDEEYDEEYDEEEFDESLSLMEVTMKKLSEDFEEDELNMYNLVKNMIDKLNEISKEDGLYWEANEIYNNCAITEDETDQYMEIFVYKDKEGNIKYSTDEEHADSYDTVEDAYEACMWKSNE